MRVPAPPPGIVVELLADPAPTDPALVSLPVVVPEVSVPVPELPELVSDPFPELPELVSVPFPEDPEPTFVWPPVPPVFPLGASLTGAALAPEV